MTDTQEQAKKAIERGLSYRLRGIDPHKISLTILSCLAEANLVIEPDWSTDISAAPKDAPVWFADDFAARIVKWDGRRWVDWRDGTPCGFVPTHWRPLPTFPAEPVPATAPQTEDLEPTGTKETSA